MSIDRFLVSEDPPCYVSLPKFKIGQAVEWVYHCDDSLDLEKFGKSFEKTGIITGMVWNFHNWPCKGWVYFVRTLNEGQRLTEEIHESQINNSDKVFSRTEIELCIHEIIECENNCNSIGKELILLNAMVKDRFSESSQNEAAREFLLEAYKELLLEQTSSIEDTLIGVRQKLVGLKTNKEVA